MTELGEFTSKSGNIYVGFFSPEEKIVLAKGPLLVGVVGAGADAFQEIAESEEEARTKIHKAIEHGNLK